MNTLLLIGGDLCERTAALLDPAQWRCIGLRRNPRRSGEGTVSWHTADLSRPQSLAFLGEGDFAGITHILYAPSPGSRTAEAYDDVYSSGLPRLLSSLAPACLKRLQRCVLVGSSAVWAPGDEWVDEDTPVDRSGFRASSLLEAEDALHARLGPGVGVALRLSGLYGPGRVRLVSGLQAGAIVAQTARATGPTVFILMMPRALVRICWR